MQRQLIAAAAVLVTAIVAVGVARGARKPYNPEAPAFRVKGPADAPIVIVEYSDFQCPACRMAVEPLKNLLDVYPGKIRVIFKHYPLEMAHPWARSAARYAECAGKQGKFWEMHDLLFETQQDWYASQSAPDAKFEALAKKLKLDLAACVKDPETDASVTRDIKDGDSRWVSSTPTFFVNGKRLVGARQLGGLGPVYIDKVLRK